MITQDDVLYMIVTDRFADGDQSNNNDVDLDSPGKRHGGDLLGITHQLPYLQDLGVTALWITPVYVNSADGYHGYHPMDFEHVDAHLCSAELGPTGSRRVIQRFVEIAHDHGMKVMLDVIVCHTAPDHPWLKDRPTWFNKADSSDPGKGWLWGLPLINHDNVDVNVYFAKNVLQWMTDTGVDAIRIDAARHVQKHFWPIFKLFAKGLRPDVTVIGEVWDRNPAVVAPYQAYHGFDSMFDYPLYEVIVDVFAREHSFGLLARPGLSDSEPQGILDQDQAYRNPCHLVTFIGNHDNPRFLHLCGGARRTEAVARMRLALSFLFTTRGIPQLYYGDELGMDGGPDPDNRRDMPWSLVDGNQLQSDEARNAGELRRFTKQLIRLRRSSTALRYGMLTTLYLTPTLYCFARTFLDDVRIVVLNNSWQPAIVDIPIHSNSRLPSLAQKQLPNGKCLVDDLNPRDRTRIDGGGIRVNLPAKSGAVYRPTTAD